uniref:WGS project CBMI000000000 data, contig CS3069_c004230 n=1 Tax=Fusarium clavum TaxID=2594811 RepID=A0A090MIH9_9HYPO|nr:unnamed protein product [Fusarium clavum]
MTVFQELFDNALNDVNASPLIEVKMYLAWGISNEQKSYESQILYQDTFAISAGITTTRFTQSCKRAWGLLDPNGMSVTDGLRRSIDKTG